MFKINNKGFTLVELIVVITILAILGTIAFLSFQGYVRDTRDTVRISDMKNISSALDLYNIETGIYPKTTDGYDITYSGSKVWSQGFFGKKTHKVVGGINKVPLDPLIKTKYIYSVTNNRQEYQVAGIFEGDFFTLNNKLATQSFAGENLTKLKIVGNYNGRIIKANTGTITYVLGVPSIITSTGATLEYIIENNLLAYNGYKNLPFQYKETEFNILGNPGIKLLNNTDLIVYQGNIENLSTQGNTSIREIFIKNLQNTYTGTTIAEKATIKDLLALDLNNLQAVEILSSSIINNNLGGDIDIVVIKPEVIIDPFLACTADGIVVDSNTTYTTCGGVDKIMCTGVGTGYIIAGCNVGTSISGTGADSFGNYYNHPDFISIAPTVCGEGYHVPTGIEWDKIMTYWNTNPKGMRDSLNIPIAGYDFPSGLALSFLYGYYWGNIGLGLSDSYVMHMRRDDGFVYSSVGFYYGANGTYEFPIRCFKD